VNTPWPSTTQLLRHFGLMRDYSEFGSDDALQRGRLVHEACHLLAARQPLDAEWHEGEWEERHPECAPYLAAYRRFLAEHQVELIECEREYRSNVHRFVSHPDQIVYLDGFGRVDLELKSGSMPKCCQLQTAGQVIAMNKGLMRRFGLLLQNDGYYKLYPHEDNSDFGHFRAMVETYWTIQTYAQTPPELEP
jgi:hypothetical protein